MLASAALSASRRLSRPGLSALCRRSAAPAASASASASASAFASRPMSTDGLPYHLVMGMPALSPTMESGSIASWNLAEGDSFSAGDSLAEIETDKATMAFEAQDDGYIAKILVEAGNGDDVSVNTPIVVVVEEEDDVAAFADFVAPVAAAPEAAAAPPSPPPVAEAAAAAPPPPPPPPPAAVEAPPAPAPVAVAAAAPAAPAAPTVGPAWGNLARVASPIAKSLAKEQQAYLDKYGSTGQVPL